jgi:hypothetical protein
MSDLIVWARIVRQSPTSFLILVSTAAVKGGEEDSASDLRTSEARTKGEAEQMRDALIGQTVEAAERRGHNVTRVHRTSTSHEMNA